MPVPLRQTRNYIMQRKGRFYQAHRLCWALGYRYKIGKINCNWKISKLSFIVRNFVSMPHDKLNFDFGT